MKRQLTLLALLTCALHLMAQQLPLKVWFKTPASYFEEAFPIGNGKLGAMVYGGVLQDRMYLNDITLWTGKPVDRTVDADAHKWIEPIREALFNENYRLADSLQLKVQGSNSQYFQPLATLLFENDNQQAYKNYKRALNLDNSTVLISYEQGGVKYQREVFASNPSKVIAMRLTASKAQSISCKLKLTALIPHQAQAVKNGIKFTGHAYGEAKNSTHFCTLLHVVNKGGTVETTDSTLSISKATEAVVYIVNETSFNGYDKHPVLQGAPYQEMANSDLKGVLASSYNAIKARHIADYQRLFKRVSLQLDGCSIDNVRTTEEQLKDYTLKKEDNNYLETLYFQFGRYLLISASRTKGVPANLQGLWTQRLFSPWRSNYTVNINLEENYWPAEVANLSEMFQPLNTFLKGLADTGSATAKNYYGINKGWCAAHNSDIWAMSNPVGEKRESPEWANWNMGGAWLMSSLWEHYLYNQDVNYLRNEAYPLMKGAAEFMLQWIIPNPKNPQEIITAPSTSPENEYVTSTDGYHGTTCYGGTADLAILRELFNNTAKAAEILGVDKDLQRDLLQAVERFHPYTVGKNGDLNEWYYDWDDYDIHHRHQTHLIGLYPGHHLSPEKTPVIAQAARKTLEMKGDKTTGWSTGWRINLWARLRDNKQAYHVYRKLLSYVSPDGYKGADRMGGGGTYPNLFDAHPPFQIDGNFGGTAGVCEMLLQSGDGVIELLPACPEPWKSGKVNGIKARGGYEVSFSWQQGAVKTITVKSLKAGKVDVKCNGKVYKLTFKGAGNQNIKL